MALVAIALIAIAAWPFIHAGRAAAARAYVAPVRPDYQYRDQTVAFYERRVREDPADQISARLLGAEYLQRYREALDIGDLQRGIRQEQRSLQLQPANNAAAYEISASGYYALHEFRMALKLETIAHAEQPADPNAPAQMALLNMEMGNYAAALHDLNAARHIQNGVAVWAAQARYDELTGNLGQAQRLMQRASQRADSLVDESAEARAWYHFRLGEMSFAHGGLAEAQAQERLAISQFPNFELAYRALARFCWAVKSWNCALDASKKGADILPEPETLGYEADAQQALGQTEAAKQTRALIFAVERLGNAYHINDRLLSVYYSEHGVRLDDSLRIAQREVRVRADEVFAQDTLAWAAAMDGKWHIAERAARNATRYGTQDPRIEFHAGVIALHFGQTTEARRRLEAALRLNPHFDPFYADEARSLLSKIASKSTKSNDPEPAKGRI